MQNITHLAHQTSKNSHMKYSKCQIIWHGWTLLFQIWNNKIINVIIKKYFFLSPLSSFLSFLSFFFLFSFSKPVSLFFVTLSFFFLTLCVFHSVDSLNVFWVKYLGKTAWICVIREGSKAREEETGLFTQ